MAGNGNGNGTAVAKKPPFETLKDMLERAQDKLAEVAPKHLKVDRMVRLLLSACSRNPKILECTPTSVLQFAMKCSETGLEPIGPGGAWPIPYENRKVSPKVTELTFIPDYRGLVNIAKRAGCIKEAWAEIVRENDFFDYELGVNPSMVHKPARGDRGDLEATYCVIVMPDDTRRFVVMDAADVAHIRSKSRASNSGPWCTDTAEMWKKSVVRRAMKPYSGMSPSLDTAINAMDDADGLKLDDARPPVAMPRAVGEVAPEPAALTEETFVPASFEQQEEAETVPVSPEPAAATKPAKQADEKASPDLVKAILAEANELGHDQASLDKLAKEFGASRFSAIRQSQAEALLKRLKGEPD